MQLKYSGRNAKHRTKSALHNLLPRGKKYVPQRNAQFLF